MRPTYSYARLQQEGRIGRVQGMAMAIAVTVKAKDRARVGSPDWHALEQLLVKLEAVHERLLKRVRSSKDGHE